MCIGSYSFLDLQCFLSYLISWSYFIGSCYCVYFTDEKTEVQRDVGICPGVSKAELEFNPRCWE